MSGVGQAALQVNSAVVLTPPRLPIQQDASLHQVAIAPRNRLLLSEFSLFVVAQGDDFRAVAAEQAEGVALLHPFVGDVFSQTKVERDRAVPLRHVVFTFRVEVQVPSSAVLQGESRRGELLSTARVGRVELAVVGDLEIQRDRRLILALQVAKDVRILE